MAIERFANTPIPSSPSTAWTTLSAGIDASTTTIPVVGFAAFSSTVQFRILIGDEYLLVTAGAGTTSWTATRGIEGSTAAVHASGASVFQVITVAGIANHPRSMTTAGDLEYLSATFAPTRLGIGSAGQFLRVSAGLPAWSSLVAGDIPDISASYLTPAAAAAAYQPLGSYAAASHTHTASQITDLATALVAFSNKTGAISQWTNDASFTTLAAVAAEGYATATSATAFSNKTGNISQWTNDSGYLTSVTAHNLLSATHGDTTAGTVARGDLITGQGASAKWVRLAKGTANQVLSMDGTATDIVWATAAGGAAWGAITGTLSAQTDLQTALGTYLPLAGGTLTGPITGTSGVVEQYNSTTAQTFRLYETRTDASNYSRLAISAPAGGPITFDGEAAGTGSARAFLFNKAMTVTGTITIASGFALYMQSRVYMATPSDGVLLLLNGSSFDDFNRLQFGGSTSSYPSLKRSTTILQSRLADDSAFAPLQGLLRTAVDAVTGLSAGVLAASTNASIVITDASGQAYRVPVII